MRHFLLYLFFIYCSLTIQAGFFDGTIPDIVIVLICIYTVKRGQVYGVALGMIAGLVIDTTNGLILGPNMLSKAMAAFLTGSIRDNLFQWNTFINALVVAIVSAVDVFLVFISLEVFSNASFLNRSLQNSVTQIIFTVAAALIMYPLLNGKRKVNLWEADH
ncbi:MAG: rod shape-determining protein MreD [Nitrospiraceae bacterium]|nr:MAG: rod shape-determining protein MreD [Nitrospiraceae bacterium]